MGKQREDLEALRIGFRQAEKRAGTLTIGFGEKTWSERRFHLHSMRLVLLPLVRVTCDSHAQ